MCVHGFWEYRFLCFSSVSVYNGFGLRNKLRDSPLHDEKARGCFFSPSVLDAGHGAFIHLTASGWDVV